MRGMLLDMYMLSRRPAIKLQALYQVGNDLYSLSTKLSCAVVGQVTHVLIFKVLPDQAMLFDSVLGIPISQT